MHCNLYKLCVCWQYHTTCVLVALYTIVHVYMYHVYMYMYCSGLSLLHVHVDTTLTAHLVHVLFIQSGPVQSSSLVVAGYTGGHLAGSKARSSNGDTWHTDDLSPWTRKGLELCISLTVFLGSWETFISPCVNASLSPSQSKNPVAYEFVCQLIKKTSLHLEHYVFMVGYKLVSIATVSW